MTYKRDPNSSKPGGDAKERDINLARGLRSERCDTLLGVRAGTGDVAVTSEDLSAGQTRRVRARRAVKQTGVEVLSRRNGRVELRVGRARTGGWERPRRRRAMGAAGAGQPRVLAPVTHALSVSLRSGRRAATEGVRVIVTNACTVGRRKGRDGRYCVAAGMLAGCPRVEPERVLGRDGRVGRNGRVLHMRVVRRKRKGRNGVALGPSGGGNPRRTVAQAVNLLGGERRTGLLLDHLANRRPRLVVFDGGKVALDDEQCADQVGEAGGATDGERCCVAEGTPEEGVHTGAGNDGSNAGGGRCQHEERCPKHPVEAAEVHGLAEAHMQQRQTGHHDEACLAESEGDPQANGRANVGGRCET